MTGRLGAAANSLTAILANPPLRRIEAAFFGFNLTEYGTWVAILVYASSATGPASVGLVALVQLIPAALYAPIAARLGDRYPRIRVLVGGYVLIAVSTLAVGTAMAVGASPPLVYVFAIVAAAAMTMPRPVQAAITPAYTETPEQLTAANGINSIFEGLGVLIGPLGAGILMAMGSPALVFFGGGLVSAVSALLIAKLGMRQPEGPDAVDGRAEPAASGLGFAAPSMLTVLGTIARDGGQLLVALVLASRYVVIGALDVLLVLLAVDALAIAGAGAGFLVAALGFGGVVGGALTLVLVGRRRLAAWILAGAIATGSALAIIALDPGVGIVLALLAGAGIGLAYLDVAGRTLLQRIGQRDVLAELFGLVEGLAMIGLAAGSLGASVLYAYFGLSAALAATAALLPAMAFAAWIRLSRVEDLLDLPVEQIALLQRVSIFALVPAPSLEAAARRLVHFAVPAHAIVFDEGDVGDRFYVVAAGSVEIRRHGVQVRTLGPGESFGEIALLRSVARTATAVAATDVELWGLDRDDFLLAITGSPQAVADAQGRADAILAGDRARA